MCGICGKIKNIEIDLEEIRVMNDVIAHRGPDDEGYYIHQNVGLGMRRLSIIDLDGGKQPMTNEDRTLWIVFNGEIYNYQELRRQLEDKHDFSTRSDTEVIVHLYEEYGEKCVDKLNGMYAFAIWDEKRQQLFMARDRLGQKPLFYAKVGNTFLFGSEIKAILASGDFTPEMDFESISHYLSLRFIPPPKTMLKKISKLPPGHFLVFKNGEINVTEYWDITFTDKTTFPEEQLIDQLEAKLKEAVRLHLVSDVPVGAFLSGGMDSSTVVAMMADTLKYQFKTFAIGVEEQDFNELPYAKTVASYFQTCHIEERVRSNLIRMLPEIIWHLDEPSDPIAACMFHAAKLASKHVKVVLGGDGGDELFAGFDRYLGVSYIDRYTLIPDLIRSKVIGPLLDKVPEDFTYKSITQKMRWVHQISALSSLGERYAEATLFFRFNKEDKGALFSEDLRREVGSLDSANVIVEKFRNSNAIDPVDKMLYADFKTRLPEHSLMLTDRMTMAHSLEARSPFLDHTLVEFLAAFPSDLKIKDKELKYALRKVGERILPEEITKRDKQGFMFPIAYWFQNDLYQFIKGFLLDSYFVKNGLFDEAYVTGLVEDHRNNRIDNHVRLWMLLNLQIWQLIYIEGLSVSQVEERMLSFLPVQVA